jgi:hypothetical protein
MESRISAHDWLRRQPSILARILAVGLLAPWGGKAVAVEVYATGFEAPSFLEGFALVPQGGWAHDVAGGDQVVTNYFAGGGQQALLGFSQPEGTNGSVSVWKPLNFDPLASGLPAVTFRVSFAIYDCSTNQLAFRDSFRWVVWNPTNRLFALDFDNATTEISYRLDDEVWVSTGSTFERADPDAQTGLYDLVITLDFAHNTWRATLNDVELVAAKAITTRGAALELGDIDAVWVAAREEGFGDNYMVFDNYRVEADTAAPQAFRLEALGRLPGQGFALRLHGEDGRRYAIDGSAGFSAWTALKTNTVTDGAFDFVDGGAVAAGQRFYRARAVAP